MLVDLPPTLPVIPAQAGTHRCCKPGGSPIGVGDDGFSEDGEGRRAFSRLIDSGLTLHRVLHSEPVLPMNRLRLALPLLLLFAFPFAAPQAQVADGGSELYIGSQRPPVRVTVIGGFQRYSGVLSEPMTGLPDAPEVSVSEFTAPLTIFAPLARNVGFSLRSSFTSVTGDAPSDAPPSAESTTSVRGLTDTQAALSYFTPLGPGSAVVNVSANIPSGTSGLEPDEAVAAFLVGQNFYGFRSPSLGQGFNVAGGLTYAFPAGDALVIGLGASYQRRGSYNPVAGANDYDPGDEILLTGGFDYGLSRASSLALDVTYAIYSADTFGDFEFQSGNALSVTAKWAGEVGGRSAGLLGRFRTKGATDYLQNVTSPDLVIPTQVRLRANVQVVGIEQFGLGLFAQGRTYAASDLFDAKALFDFGVTPSYRLLPNATLLTRAAVTFGDLSGFEVGGGLAWEF